MRRKTRSYLEMCSQSIAEDNAPCNTRSTAQAWGRTAARLGWGLDGLSGEVAPEFQEVAIASYKKRMASLGSKAA